MHFYSDVHEADKLKWEHEQTISKKTAKLDEHKRDCNRLIIGLDIDEMESKNLMKSDPDYVKNWAYKQEFFISFLKIDVFGSMNVDKIMGKYFLNCT